MSSYYEKLLATGEVKCIDEEIPFEIPQGWEWCRLGEISTYAQTKRKINASNADSQLWGLDLEDIEKGGRLLNIKTVGERKAIGDKTIFNRGDILYSKLRPYLLKILVAPEGGICTPEIIPFTCYGNMCKDYIVSFLKSPYVDDYINSATFGVKMPRVSTETMTSLLVPLPPLSEQFRIDTKAKELMPYIDGYGKAQNKLNKLNDELSNTIRKSILQEAIQGKLVPQIAEEGTAKDLLEQIKAEKQKLVKEGKLKKSALASSVIFRGDDNSFKFPFQKEQEKRNDPKYKNVPLIVAPGKEDAYLEEKAKHDAAKVAEAERIIQEKKEAEAQQTETDEQQQAQSEEELQDQPENDNSNGWEGLLKNFGLNGFSDIGNNLGYVIAMLPDILVGLFTGKTQSLGLKDNMMPIAAILAGMFVKNPLLKMTLIGMGGAKLLNKAGHEALANKRESNDGNAVSYDNTTAQAVQYKSYPDEPLNPRIANPVLQGNCLVATIDRVPYTIQLPEHVVGAYQAGALPLNTLANAVLAKSDQMRQMAERNYGEQEVRNVRNEAMENAEQREVIQRSR